MTEAEMTEAEMATRSQLWHGSAAVVGAMIGVLAVSCGSGRASPSGSTATSADVSPNHAPHTGGVSGGRNQVAMRLIAYVPDELAVASGATVTWKQTDAGVHTVTSGAVEKDASGMVETKPDGRFDSGEIQTGNEFTHTFEDSGTYEYFCKVHPATMTGRVTVE